MVSKGILFVQRTSTGDIDYTDKSALEALYHIVEVSGGSEPACKVIKDIEVLEDSGVSMYLDIYQAYATSVVLLNADSPPEFKNLLDMLVQIIKAYKSDYPDVIDE